MELESKPFVIDTTKWKNELKCNGFILCDKESCQMGFLSLRGMEVHRQKCVGHVNEGVSIYAFCLQSVIAQSHSVILLYTLSVISMSLLNIPTIPSFLTCQRQVVICFMYSSGNKHVNTPIS